jgi:hypothetical protein
VSAVHFPFSPALRLDQPLRSAVHALKKVFPAARRGVTSISVNWIRKQAENWPGATSFKQRLNHEWTSSRRTVDDSCCRASTFCGDPPQTG